MSDSASIRQRAEAFGVDLDRLPEHIAVIMDGNGRWATANGKDRLLGHAQGYQTLRDVVDQCGQIGLKFLTVYGFSSENWRRPEEEVGGLMELIERAMHEQMANLKSMNVRTFVIGRLHELPNSLRAALEDGVESTKDCTGLTFTLAINYGGRAEIVDAIRALTASGAPPESIDERAVSSAMYAPALPETDLMIRTAGELRWSNFLLWQSAYAELYVTEKTWPEFDERELFAAIAAYQRRTRKFGAVVE
jgi:undecaprenyl diphosphate synthase